MKSIYLKSASSLLSTVLLLSGPQVFAIDNQIDNKFHHLAPTESFVASAETIEYNGKIYKKLVFIKHGSFETFDVFVDELGNQIPQIPTDRIPRAKISDRLLGIITSAEEGDSGRLDELLMVRIALNVPSIPWRQNVGYAGSVAFDETSAVTTKVDGYRDSEEGISSIQSIRAEARADYRARKSAVVSSVKNRILNALRIDQNAILNNDNATALFIDVHLNNEQLLAIKDNLSDIASIDIVLQDEDTIWNAMAESGVDPHALTNPAHSGDGVGIWMTETGCPEAGYIANYTRLGGISQSNHSRLVSSIMRFVSPDSWIYCRANATVASAVTPNAADLAGSGGNPPVHIINRSNGVNDGDDTYTPLSRDWDNISYDNDILVLVSAGNEGGTHGELRSPSKGTNILSIGAYDDQTDTIANFSSFGDPETRSVKPEMSGPGVTISVPGLAANSGTSFSNPHVAAMAADLLEAAPGLMFQPAALKSAMIAGAKRPVAGAFDRIGEGGADYFQFVTGNFTRFWNGNNAYFDVRDVASDGVDDGWITVFQNLPAAANEARIVLTWQNEGAYTEANATAAQPLGSDYDFRYFDPNGAYLGGGFRLTDQYEIVSFNPNISGNYKIQIRRASNNDTDSKTDIGLSINWQ